MYRSNPKFSDIQVLANKTQITRSSLIRVYNVCHCVYTFWKHFSGRITLFSIFRTNTYFGCRDVKNIYGNNKPNNEYYYIQNHINNVSLFGCSLQCVDFEFSILLGEQSDLGLHCLSFCLHLLDS